MAAADRSAAYDGTARGCGPRRGSTLDVLYHRPNELPAFLEGEMSPAGQRNEHELLFGREGSLSRVLTTPYGPVLSRSVDPLPYSRCAGEELLCAVRPWPLERRRNQALLHSLLEEVAQAADLRLRLVRNGNGAVAAREHDSVPVMETLHLLGQLGLEVAHESSQPDGFMTDDEKVEVVGEEAIVDDSHAVAPRGPSEGADHGSIERWRRP
ncbi:MAG: hypothetical protein R2991_15820 [Thermoanaerobaculia bacterium]